jgi:ABC-type Zn uptake system ZnuABC Zn-binding protein ZnuA
VSIHPIASLVEQLVGDWAQVHTLIPPGSSEHSTELTPEARQRLAQADLVVIAGLGLDNWVERRAQDAAGNKRQRVVRFADLVLGPQTQPAEEAHDHAHHDGHDHDEHDDHASHAAGVTNPHLWLDPTAADRFVSVLGGQLEPLFPDNAQALRNRVHLFRDRLGYLDTDYREQLRRVPNRRLVTFHNAFDPLAARYGLEVVAHLTEPASGHGGDVKPARLAQAIAKIKEHNLKVVYAEPQFPDAAAQAIAEQTGVKVLRLDPLGNPRVEGYRTYEETMRSNLKVLVEGQSMK